MKLRICILILIALSACSTNQQLPTWLLQSPNDPSYFSSVVSESKALPNFQELARDKALRDISMQISTQIEASLNISEREAWGISSSEYLSTLQANSSAQIRDLQLRDSHANSRTYYAYYRLNKAEYYAQRKILCQRAVASAADLLSRYDAAPAELAIGIPLLLQALEILVDYLDLELLYESPTDSVNIYHEISSRLRALPTALQMSFDPPRMTAMAKIAQSQYAPGEVYFQQQACRNLPLSFTFDPGEGQITTQIRTDSQGQFELMIKRLNSSESPQRIRLDLDKEVFAKGLSKAAVMGLWQSIRFSPAYLTLDVQKPRVYLDYSFVASYQNGLRDAVANQVATLGLELCSKLEDAQYLLKVRIFAKPGEYLANLDYYTSYGDIQLTLQNPASGAMVNYLERLNLKSGANSRAKAESAVEYEAVKTINDGMLYRLLYDAIFR